MPNPMSLFVGLLAVSAPWSTTATGTLSPYMTPWFGEVTGTLALEVNDVESFLADSESKAGLEHAIFLAGTVLPEDTITLELGPANNWAQKDQRQVTGRRLSGAISGNYTIQVPTADNDETVSLACSRIAENLNENGGHMSAYLPGSLAKKYDVTFSQFPQASTHVWMGTSLTSTTSTTTTTTPAKVFSATVSVVFPFWGSVVDAFISSPQQDNLLIVSCFNESVKVNEEVCPWTGSLTTDWSEQHVNVLLDCQVKEQTMPELVGLQASLQGVPTAEWASMATCMGNRVGSFTKLLANWESPTVNLQISNVGSSTKTTTTLTTTSAAFCSAAGIGELDMLVKDPSAFLDNPIAWAGVMQALASVANTDQDHVKIHMASEGARHLDMPNTYSSSTSSGPVTVNYTIEVSLGSCPGVVGRANNIQDLIIAEPPSSLAALICSDSYLPVSDVQISEIPAPSVHTIGHESRELMMPPGHHGPSTQRAFLKVAARTPAWSEDSPKAFSPSTARWLVTTMVAASVAAVFVGLIARLRSRQSPETEENQELVRFCNLE